MTLSLEPQIEAQWTACSISLSVCIPCKSSSLQEPGWCCSGQICEVNNWEMDCINKDGGEKGHFKLCPVSSLPIFSWCVYLSAIPTCSDDTHGTHPSLGCFLSHWICKHTVFFIPYPPGVQTSSSRYYKWRTPGSGFPSGSPTAPLQLFTT